MGKLVKEKENDYIELVSKFAAYVKKKEKVVGIYCTNEDMLKANKNLPLKNLVKVFNYKIQTVIK